MNALSSAVSITLHAAVGAALLLGTTKTVRSDPARPREVRVFLPREVAVNRGDGMGGPSLPGPIDVAPPDFNSMSGLATTPEGLTPQEGLSPVFSPTGGSESSATTGSRVNSEVTNSKTRSSAAEYGSAASGSASKV